MNMGVGLSVSDAFMDGKEEEENIFFVHSSSSLLSLSSLYEANWNGQSMVTQQTNKFHSD